MRCLVGGCGKPTLVPLCDDHAAVIPEKLFSELCEKADEYWVVRQATLAWLKMQDRQSPSPEEAAALRARL